MNAHIAITAAAALLGVSLAHAVPACQVESGAATAALVELYTSEGCSSCPPADDVLRAVRRSAGPQAVVVPLALHVSYWDQIGWKDVFAQPAFDTRQRMLVATGGNKVVYTPQFFINGRELRSWSGSLPAAISQVNARPAVTHITLKSTPLASGMVLLEASADTRATDRRQALFLALSESKLVSQVTRGENSGATLRHDDTVRTWLGPIALAGGSAVLRQEIRLAPEWHAQHLQAVAFVQDADDGSVLQAVSTAPCIAAAPS